MVVSKKGKEIKGEKGERDWDSREIESEGKIKKGRMKGRYTVMAKMLKGFDSRKLFAPVLLFQVNLFLANRRRRRKNLSLFEKERVSLSLVFLILFLSHFLELDMVRFIQ